MVFNPKKVKKIIFLFAITVAIYSGFFSKSLLSEVFADVMSSSNYKIQSDSINFGGAYGDSASYKIEDTFGEVATGESSSSNYRLKAGYQQMQEIYLAMTSADDVVLSPSIPGIVGGTATGSTYTIVTTDSPSGYELSIKAQVSPALVSGANSFSDYVPSGSNPDFNFAPPVVSVFGFSPSGLDIYQKYKDDGISCNTGSLDTAEKCWNGLSTSNEVISRRTNGNHPNGVETKINFRAEVATNGNQPDGNYNATTTLTLFAN